MEADKAVYGDLVVDPGIIKKLENFQESISKIKQDINKIKEPQLYQKLDPVQKIKYDLFTSYSLCTLYWMYLRNLGKDPSKILREDLEKVQLYMNKLKEIEDFKLRPRVNKEASGRFVKSALWENRDESEPLPKKTRTE